MSNLRPFLLMDKLQASRFREETAQDENRLEPTPIRGGPHVGKFALPERVIFDLAHEARRDAFRMLPVVSLDIGEAFPPIEEDDDQA